MPLASSVDGNHTFGWTDGMAEFPATQPVITMPPFTELEFPLHLRPKSDTFEDVIAAIMKSLRQPLTPLNASFFARANVDALQFEIQQRIAQTLGVAVDRQSDWELLQIMRRVYMETANNWPESVEEEAMRMNALVLQIATEAVSRNITAYLTFRHKLANPVPIANPADMLTNAPLPTGVPQPLF